MTKEFVAVKEGFVYEWGVYSVSIWKIVGRL